MFRFSKILKPSQLSLVRNLTRVSTPKLHSQSFSSKDSTEFDELFEELAPKLQAYYDSSAMLENRVTNLLKPEEMDALLYSELPSTAVDTSDLMDQLDVLLQYSTRTSSPMFMDKLYAGTDPIVQLSTLLQSALNCNVHTYDSAPVITCIELILTKQLCSMFFKLSPGDESNTAGGIFVPGGSYSNMLGMRLARDKYFPDCATTGSFDDQIPIVLTSADAHYSVVTSASTVGIGSQNVIRIKSNSNGSVNIQEVRNVLVEIEKENVCRAKKKLPLKRPFMFMATAGTTVLGGFDNMKELATICSDYDLWLHSDACWGGALVFSESEKAETLLNGIELSDSVSYNPHKFISTGLTCSTFLCKDEQYLYKSCEPPNADYLFHGDNPYDIGRKTLQCGRPPDCLKLYLSWLRHGTEGLRERVDNALNNADFIADLVGEDVQFFLYSAQYANICFWYVPQKYVKRVEDWQNKGFPPNELEDEVFQGLKEATCSIQKQLKSDGKMLIDYSPYKHLPPFFRLVSHNYRQDEAHLEIVFQRIKYAAKICRLG